jgi:hypothetical protein
MRIGVSKHCWPEVKGSQLMWERGDRAHFRSKDGATIWPVTIEDPEVKEHAESGGRPVLECRFVRSPDGPNVVRAVNADQVEPCLMAMEGKPCMHL